MDKRQVKTEIRKRIDAIFRPDPPKKEKLLAGMAHWAKELDDQFLAKARHRARVREALALSLDTLPQKYEADAAFEKARAKARAALRKCQLPKLPPVKVPKHVDRIFSGSVGASYGPPYDVQWTWSQQQETLQARKCRPTRTQARCSSLFRRLMTHRPSPPAQR